MLQLSNSGFCGMAQENWLSSREAMHLGDPLHARGVAPEAALGGRLERAAGDGAQAALRRGLVLLLQHSPSIKH